MQATVTLSDFDLTEVIDGIEYMSPAPNLRHQDIVAEIFYLLKSHVKAKLVLVSPYDVRLSEKITLQPDILVFATISDKVDKKLPQIVIEVLSTSSIVHDRFRKFGVYQSAGIQEYWLVDPETDSIEVYDLREGEYQLHVQVVRQGEVTSLALPNLKFQIEDIFN